MSEATSYEALIEAQRKEKKDLQAKTQRMKHAIPKGDKKKKKEVSAKIAMLMAELDLKHENELKEHEGNSDIASSVAGAENYGTSSTTVSRGGCDIDQLSTEDCLNLIAKHSETDAAAANETDLKESELKPQEKCHAVQKLSKAQKRRNKKAQMEKEREKAIAEEEKQNLSSLRNLESEKIRKKLCERNLSIHEVQSDGDCLYKAVEHQLSILNLPQMTVKNLRHLTSEYMLSHVDDFIPFLTNTETGDVMTEEEYIKYCEDIATTPVWGGHVEIQALSHVCGRSIEVIQADCPSVIAGDETAEPKLIISYHRHVYGLGEHYNSVIPAPKSQKN